MRHGHDAHTEWISIGDFMAGIVGVLVLFFLIAVLISSAAKVEAKKKRESAISMVMKDIQDAIGEAGVNGLVVVPDQQLIKLSDTSFAKGSACLNESIKQQLIREVGPQIKVAMQRDLSLTLQIEGHSDNVPVSRLSNPAVSCAPFDDNYTLSAGRAREARNALLSELNDADINRRVSVVGYGPDRLIDVRNPASAENRRVELRLVMASESATTGP